RRGSWWRPAQLSGTQRILLRAKPSWPCPNSEPAAIIKRMPMGSAPKRQQHLWEKPTTGQTFSTFHHGVEKRRPDPWWRRKRHGRATLAAVDVFVLSSPGRVCRACSMRAWLRALTDRPEAQHIV